MLISLIVPCYNEEEAMPLFYKEASRVAAEMKASHGARADASIGPYKWSFTANKKGGAEALPFVIC